MPSISIGSLGGSSGGGGSSQFPPPRYRIWQDSIDLTSIPAGGSSSTNIATPANWERYLIGVEFFADEADVILAIDSYSAVDKNGGNHYTNGAWHNIFRGTRGTYINFMERFGAAQDCTGGLNNLQLKNESAIAATNPSWRFYFMEFYIG